MTEGLRILNLVAENVKKIRAVEVTPTGDMVIVSGKNGAGKSSLLDSIFWALGGTKAIQKQPIRKGADRAYVKVALGGQRVQLVVERNFTAGGSVVRVSSPEGARFPGPQAMLDGLLGELTFDPLAFVNDGPREQFDALRRLAPLDVDVDQLDGLNLRDYEERTEINRQAKAARAQADGIAVPSKPEGDVIDTAALKDRMAEASRANVAAERMLATRREAAKEAERMRGTAADYRETARKKRADASRLAGEAETLDVGARTLEAGATTMEEELARTDQPAPVDMASIRAELDQAEGHNQAVTRFVELLDRKALYLSNAEELEKQARELTDMMAARTKAKEEAIARAPMPVEGLSFGDGVVTFNGVPFDQASSAEQLRVSVAIAMAANPKLKVIRIKEGSLLDADGLALIAAMASEREYQVWVEVVNANGAPSILIEDGSVVAVDGEPVAAKAEVSA